MASRALVRRSLRPAQDWRGHRSVAGQMTSAQEQLLFVDATLVLIDFEATDTRVAPLDADPC